MWWLAWLAVQVACMLGYSDGKNIPTYAGPYITYVERFTECDDPSQHPYFLKARVSHFNPSKPHERQWVSGTFTAPEAVTDNTWFRAVVDVFKNNQWKKNAFIFNFPRGGCSGLRDLEPEPYRILLNGSLGRQPCYIPAGTHVFNSSILWVSPRVPILPYGRYQTSAKMGETRASTPTYCTNIVFNIIPQPV